MLQQQMAQKVAGQNPQLNEDENMPGDQPSANGGAPQQSSVSPKGAINQNNQRNGASVALESEGTQ